MIRFFCDNCRKRLKAPDKASGREIFCPRCGLGLTVPCPNHLAEELLPRPRTKQPRNADATALPPDPTPEPPIVDPPPATGTGVDPKFCTECGARIRRQAAICPKCGVPQPGERARPVFRSDLPRDTNRLAAGICAILMGGLGIHKFILGYPAEGVVMLLVFLGGLLGYVLGFCLCGLTWPLLIGTAAMGIIGFIEGIIYLTKSDEDFYETYIVEKKGWF